MNSIKRKDFVTDLEIDEIRGASAAGEPQLRTLQDLEMGWVAGGDDIPVWPH